MGFGDNPMVTVLLLAAIVVTVLVTMGCIEDEEVEIDGIVVDGAPEIGNPDYERQEYWIVVEVTNGTRYKIEGEGIWLGYNITDKFHKTVPPEIVKEEEESSEEEKVPSEGLKWVMFLIIIILIIIMTAMLLMRRKLTGM